MSTIKNLILLALEEDKDNEIHGTNHLAELLLTENRAWVRSKLRELQRQGVLNIIKSDLVADVRTSSAATATRQATRGRRGNE